MLCWSRKVWKAVGGRGEGVRTDPRLPVQHLPMDWPAVPAQRVFQQVHDRVSGPARVMADRMLDTVPDEPAD
ncbi:hypothetical protein OG883_39925 [Streptomyces sp. NBC_01142]|uniref:PaaX family transcriptional regulator C-terminal domain-containing protein n=1 Tax=Streptomyces sp. NBC_01142 TaxID=2975865 RepID=UPI002255392F|nr:PaaX family transcriptional regulator C-terminal domain-containing protein [Streptomyces sp. NBC_01142]MCX4825875.1 hypothetical protein [Streptomyces sp. NBC_01142]